jgi:hypothetical protein
MALVMFFSVTGTLHIIMIYRRTVREIRPSFRGGFRLVDIPGLVMIAMIPGVLLLFLPRFTERSTLLSVVGFLLERGSITQNQAKEYLLTKSIRWTP